jgi:hypothetical protein
VLAGSGIDEFFVLNLQLHEVATGKNITTYMASEVYVLYTIPNPYLKSYQIIEY